MGRTIWWPMQGKSESKIGQQDRKDRVVLTKETRVRKNERIDVNVLGTVLYLCCLELSCGAGGRTCAACRCAG